MSLKKHTIANFVGQGWLALMALAFIPIYIRYIGVEAWGLIGFMSMLQAFSNLLDMGLSQTISREMSRFKAGAHTAQSIKDLLHSIELIYFLVACIVFFLIWLLAPWISNSWLNSVALPAPTVTYAITIMGLVISTRMVEGLYRGAIQGLQDHVWLNVFQCFFATLRWGGAVAVLEFITPSVVAFFSWHGIVSILSIFFMAKRVRISLPDATYIPRFSVSSLFQIQKFAGGIALTALLSLILTQMDKIILSKILALGDFGVYMLAASATSALTYLGVPIVLAVAPRLTEFVVKSEQDMVASIFHTASQTLATVLLPCGLLMATFSKPLLMAWTGNESLADNASPLLTLLALGTICNVLMYIPYTAQLAHGWTAFAVRTNVIALSIIIPLLLWSVPRYGALGGAWSWLVLNLGYVLVAPHFMHNRILKKEKWKWYSESVLKPIILTSILMFLARNFFVLESDGGLIISALLAFAFIAISTIALALPNTRMIIERIIRPSTAK